MSVAKCGTPSGANAHRRRGERPCPACARSESRKQAARIRAYSRLAKAHPAEWRALLAEEQAR